MLTAFVLFLVILNVIFYFFDPREIVAQLGVESVYLITFLVAAVGGVSTITGTVLYATIVTFAAGGVNPLLLGLVGGVGIFISDSILFYILRKAKNFTPHDWEVWFQRIESYVEKYPRWVVIMLAYVYAGLSPLPNDLLIIALIVSGLKYRHVGFVLLAGGVTLGLITAYFGSLLM